MPRTENKAKKYMVLVCEESYAFSIWDDEEFNNNTMKILRDAMDEDVDDIWYEYWIVSEFQEAKDHPARNAHELHGREWREM